MRSILTLALIFALSTFALAQDEGYRHVGPGGFALPQSSMSIADIIDILTDYSLIHQDRMVGGNFIGLTEFDKKRITIDDSMDFAIRRNTVIHELLHVWYLKHANLITGGYDTGEAAIALESGRVYEELFVKIPMQKLATPEINVGDIIVINQ